MLPPREDWATIKKISWIRTNDTWIPTRRNSLFTAADLIWCPVIQSQGNFCITQRWLRHLFIDVPPYRSGLWDEVTPHYVNWAIFYFFCKATFGKDLKRHPLKGTSTAHYQLVMARSILFPRHLHVLRGQDSNVCARREQKPSLLGLCRAAAKGALYEPANSGLWAQNATTSPPRDRNRSYYRTTDRGFAKYFLGLKCSEVTVFYGILLNKIRQQS